MFEARAGVEWRRYWFNMHSQMGDRAIAGGMVDQSFAFTARVALLIGASSAIAQPDAGSGADSHAQPAGMLGYGEAHARCWLEVNPEGLLIAASSSLGIRQQLDAGSCRISRVEIAMDNSHLPSVDS